jgi:ADP-heptose:LPS heptosyltransferase
LEEDWLRPPLDTGRVALSQRASFVKVSTMRRIDRWVGLPVCFLLTVSRRCGDLRRRVTGPRAGSVERILFVKLAEQGATVLAYPAIRRAIQMVGRQNVYFVVFDENRFVLDAMDVIPHDNVVTISTSGLVGTFFGALRALRKLRRIRPDAAIDYEFFARSSAALAYLSGARIRVGLHASGEKAPNRGDLLTHRIRYDPDQHTSELFAQMVEALKRSPEDLDVQSESLLTDKGELPVFQPTSQELTDVKLLVTREARTDHYRPLVLLNANASDLLPLRRWPAERYVELAQRLIESRPDLHVAFTGSPSEGPVVGELVRSVGSGRCFSMAAKTTLRELLVLYYLADVLVTNDSGPAHFATMTPIRVITLFGPETPARFGSKGPRAEIFWKNLTCSPCVDALNNRLSTCRDNQCMQAITVDEVLESVLKALKA